MSHQPSPNTDQLIAALQQLKLTGREIAEILWLTLQCQDTHEQPVVVTPPPSQPKLSNSKQPPTPPDGDLPIVPPAYPQTTPSGEIAAKTNRSSSDEDNTLPIPVPNPSSLRQPLQLARALRPFMQKIASGREVVLDEQATADRIAEERIRIPILKPALEPWLDLALVVDESNSMIFWRQTIQELQQLLEKYGVFRDVQTWGLVTDEQEKVYLRRGIGKKARHHRHCSPRELIDPSGRRLILVVSDCVSDIWYNGEALSALKIWVKHSPVAIVQMLPQWLWLRTGLSLGASVQLGSLTPGVVNQELLIKEILLWDDINFATGIKVPVLTLEHDLAMTWSEMVAGKSYARVGGFVFSSEFEPFADMESETADSEEQVANFRLAASPIARKLASLLSAAPVITLPIVRLIQEIMLSESQQVHVAEVFLSGILKPLSPITPEINPDEIQYAFVNEEIRDIFLKAAPQTDTLRVLDEISKYFAQWLGKSQREFYALLRKPGEAQKNAEFDPKPFAQVTAQVLKRLGGNYTRFAEELEGQSVEEPAPAKTGRNWAIALGIDGYIDLRDNKYAVRDAEAMRDWFQTEAGFERVDIFTDNSPLLMRDSKSPELSGLTRRERLVKILDETLKTKIPLLSADDNLWFFFSGYGVHFENIDYLVVPTEISEKVEDTAIPLSYIVAHLRRSGAGNIILFLDADRDRNTHIDRLSLNRNPEQEIPRSPSNSSQFNQGVIIFHASSPGEGAYENASVRHGAFTYALLEILRNQGNELTAGQLGELLRDRVEEINRQYKFGKQTPMMTAEPDSKVNLRLLPKPTEFKTPTGVDYTKLRNFLAAQQWKQADEETANIMLKIAGQQKKGFLEAEDIAKFPCEELRTIDQLWINYSQGRFGFTKQKQIYQTLRGNIKYNQQTWEDFGDRVGWRKNDKWVNYTYFTFSLDAPIGHLPTWVELFNLDVRGYRIGRIKSFLSRIETCNSSDRFSPQLQTFEFDVVTVNARGEEIKREKNTAQYFTQDLGNKVTLEMVAIRGGSFLMGSPEDEAQRFDSEIDSESPQHEVTVPPFFMCKYPVTQAQWKAVATLPQVNRELNPDPSRFKGANRPVERVSWYDAVEFCSRLSQHTGQSYYLPSEAEWEYACRAGTTTPFHFGETITSELANYNANYTYGAGVKGTYREQTTEVGSFEVANAFGLYDMHGNVWEWCLDDWHDNYEGAPTDGSPWFDNYDNLYQKQRYAVLRGGAWGRNPIFCRSASRNSLNRAERVNVNLSFGFRVVSAVGRIIQ